MENHSQIQAAERSAVPCEAPSAALSVDAICIPRSRYDELIRAEMEREILFHAYQHTSAYSMEPVMDAIFNPDFKYKGNGSGDSAK